MGTELAKFDMNDAKQRIADSIKASFVMMFPEEAWTALVSKEIEDFVSPQRDRYYNNQQRTSNLQDLIRFELNEFAKKKIKEELESERYRQSWASNGKQITSDAVKEIVAEGFQDYLKSAISQFVQVIVSDIHNKASASRY